VAIATFVPKMDVSSKDSPPLSPTAAVEVKETRVDSLAVTTDVNGQIHAEAQKIPQAGLKNYFVSITV